MFSSLVVLSFFALQVFAAPQTDRIVNLPGMPNASFAQYSVSVSLFYTFIQRRDHNIMTFVLLQTLLCASVLACGENAVCTRLFLCARHTLGALTLVFRAMSMLRRIVLSSIGLPNTSRRRRPLRCVSVELEVSFACPVLSP